MEQLIDQMRRDGIRVWAADGKVRYDGPRAAVTPRLLDLLRTHRDEILAHLATGPAGDAAREDHARIELRPIRVDPGAPVVFVHPPAGAGPGTFRHWRDVAPAGLEVVAVSIPGREDRLDEQPYTEVGPLADRIAEAIDRYGDRPHAVFGHSSGGLVGREVARRSTSGLRLLAVGGTLPPDRLHDGTYEPTDAELLADIVGWGGIPASALEHPESVRAFLPGMRSDMQVFESCRRACAPQEQLDVPVVAFAGVEDEFARPADCTRWSEWTTAGCTVHELPGGHAFPLTQGRAILTTVRDRLSA